MWWWVLIWLLLLVIAGVYLGARAWGLWGRLRELGSELALAQQRLDEAQGMLDLLGEQTGSPDELAVFDDARTIRRRRDADRRHALAARRLRRAKGGPAWARHVD